MNNVESILSYAENNCKAHGARLTNKRKQVLSGLLKSQKAMSAYELVDFCREEFGEKSLQCRCTASSTSWRKKAWYTS